MCYGDLVTKWVGRGFALIQVKKERRDSAELPEVVSAVSAVEENGLLFLGHQQLWPIVLKTVRISQSKGWDKRQLCPWRKFFFLLRVRSGEVQRVAHQKPHTVAPICSI